MIDIFIILYFPSDFKDKKQKGRIFLRPPRVNNLFVVIIVLRVLIILDLIILLVLLLVVLALAIVLHNLLSFSVGKGKTQSLPTVSG